MQSAQSSSNQEKEVLSQTISFKASPSLENFYLQKSRDLGVPLSNLYREALSKFVHSTDPSKKLQGDTDLVIANRRIQQLEKEVYELKLQSIQTGAVQRSRDEINLEAFANERVTLAMRKLAESVEKGTVPPKSYDMLTYFLTFCPQ
jgi:hypothetical protein